MMREESARCRARGGVAMGQGRLVECSLKYAEAPGFLDIAAAVGL